MKKSIMAMSLLLLCHSALATDEEMQKLIKNYGFEYRPDQEVPWGVPITAKLSKIKTDKEEFEVDLAAPIQFKGLEGFMRDYIAKHAANEIALQTTLFGDMPVKPKIDLENIFYHDMHLDFYPPPVFFYRAKLPEIIDAKNRSRDASCSFYFLKNENQYFLIYYKRDLNSSTFRSEEPHCDISQG